MLRGRETSGLGVFYVIHVCILFFLSLARFIPKVLWSFLARVI